MRVRVRTASWAIILAAGIVATARPGQAQVITYTPYPVITGTGFSVLPGPHIGFSFTNSHLTGPYSFVGTSISGWVPFPALGGAGGGGGLMGAYGGGGGGFLAGQGGFGQNGFGGQDPFGGQNGFDGQGGYGGQGGNGTGTAGAGSGTTGRSGDRQRAAKKPETPSTPREVNSRKDEGRLSGLVLARLVRVEGAEAIIAVNTKTPLAGREAWVDIPTRGAKLAASRPMYHLGSVTGTGPDAGTYRLRIEDKADDPGLVDSMPIWLLLPAGSVTSAAQR
jgi:hypothetical protein